MTGVWGSSGWLVFLLIPVAFWVFLSALLVLVFSSGPPVEVEQPVVEVEPEPAREPRRQRSALSWLPPVAPHH